MSLGFLLSVLSDQTSVNVWQENEIIAVYDGKESIDDKYNDLTVKSVSAGYFKIDVEV